MAATRTSPNAGEIMAESATELMDWDGNEIEDGLGQEYAEYVNSTPPKEDLRRYRKPALYWEPRYPGCSLQPYPRMGAFNSTDTGLWTAHNKVQEDAIRTHLQLSTQTDPDLLKLTADETAVMNGAKKGAIRFCQDCYFVSCSLTAVDLHETLNGHSTKSAPRKD